MFNFICKFFLTLNATFLILIVYLIKLDEKEYIQLSEWIKRNLHIKFTFFSQNTSILFSLLIIVLLTKILIVALKLLETDDLKGVEEVEQVNNSFLPTYLGYFFIALSINNARILFWIYFIVFIFTFISSSLYFNPLFLLWGYNFYNITTKNQVKIFLITKKNIRDPKQVSFEKIKRINNFTYIDMEVYNE